MKNKGFTLIELLAVIIIMGIITLLAVPEISDLIDKTNNKAFKASIEGLIASVKNEAASKYPVDKSYMGKYSIIDGNIVGRGSFNIEGELPNSGIFMVREKGISSFVIHDDYWCAIKNEGDKDFILNTYDGECKITTLDPIDVVDPITCYEFSNGTITDYYVNTEGCDTDVFIPESINGVAVETIGEFSFDSNGITSVVFPSTLKNIGRYAFNRNNLISVTIPDSVLYIGERAFSDNMISNIDLPELLFMDVAVFNDNQLSDSEAYIYKRNVDGTIDNTVLLSYGGSKRDGVTIPSNISKLGDYSFEGNSLTSINIPNTVTAMGLGTFRENNLTNIEIPTSITRIEFTAFSNNILTEVIIPDSITYIGQQSFSTNKITNLVIPDSVTYIEFGAFENNLLPDNQAFVHTANAPYYLSCYGGAKKDNVIIPSTFTEISFAAFSSDSINSITIPNTITYIGVCAFMNNNLTEITIPDSVTYIGDLAFKGNNLTNVVIPSSVTSISEEAFAWNKLTSVSLPNTLTNISSGVFLGNRLESIIIPNSVERIESYALYKSDSSNPLLSSIIYGGTRTFDWSNIVNGEVGTEFTTGTVNNTLGDVTISAN
ncbi:MAG: leucine-rich repeat protein [Bacilli bacterium]|nr:leucine-rich repeat protein [Bacilli bacterium]